MAKKLTFDNSLTQDIKNAVNDSYIDNIKMIDIDDIIPNSENFYSMDNIDELADDIERQGLKNVLVVYPTGNGKYILKSGHRRCEAVKLLINAGRRKSHTVPCYVDGVKSAAETKIDLIMLNATARTYTDADVMQQYKELTKAYETYENETGTRLKGRMRERIAEAMNVSPAQVGKIENITHNAIPDIIESVEKGEVSISTANEIAKLPEAQQEKYAADIENVTHKEVKAAVQAQKKTSSIPEKKKEPEIEDDYSEFGEDSDNICTESDDYNDTDDFSPKAYTIYDEEAEILNKYMDKIINLLGDEYECEVLNRLFDRINDNFSDEDIPFMSI